MSRFCLISAICASALFSGALTAAEQALSEFTGKISAIDQAAKTVTVVDQGTAGSDRTFAIDDKTEIRLSNKPATAQELTVDLWAVVSYQPPVDATKPVATKIRAMKHKPETEPAKQP